LALLFWRVTNCRASHPHASTSRQGLADVPRHVIGTDIELVFGE
jgi:hypothetical protein